MYLPDSKGKNLVLEGEVDLMPRKTGDLFALSGHVALITGAVAGFGEALAVGFAEY